MDNLLGRFFSNFCSCEKITPIIILDSGLSSEQKTTYAMQLVDNPVYKEVMDSLEREAFFLWSKTSSDNISEREYLFKHFNVVKLIRRRINGYLSDAAIDERASLKRMSVPQPTWDGKNQRRT